MNDMPSLTQQECEACSADAPKVSNEELAELIREIPDWAADVVDNVLQLVRTFEFDNFVDAIAFANRVGELAEEAGHHPSLLVEWGSVTVRWWSHKIKGLHRLDFLMAAKTDQIFKD